MGYISIDLGLHVLARNILNYVNKDECSWSNAAIENGLPVENSNACHDFTSDKKQSNINSTAQKPRFSTKNQLKKMREFKIVHLNIRSLVKNIDQFRLFLHNQQFDIVSLNETIMDDSVPDNEIYLNGYDLIWTKWQK